MSTISLEIVHRAGGLFDPDAAERPIQSAMYHPKDG